MDRHDRSRGTGNPLNRMQSQDLKRELGLRGIVNAYTIPDLELVAGLNPIDHRLNTDPQGWLVVRLRDAPAIVYEAKKADRFRLYLASTAGCVVGTMPSRLTRRRSPVS